MKKILSLQISLVVLLMFSCKKDYPVDGDGLLITGRSDCYVSGFELLGADFQTVRTKLATIDTTAQTINVEVLYGTDLRNLYPQFSLVTDAILDPKIVGRTDFSDLSAPREWTVVSGNRKVRKTYKVFLTVKQ
ncbi:hypothetical protein [Arcticibacter tournemirensis]|uniref:Uncharacterized protein n=1 Tax=Arcticibacter tournemirensis TaxID=699437 RepID=A0A4Q0MCE9_9SPHI|nr:hypothetical protein [Arcticibacter tournemirensis]RXF70569.1 hypothetical protein EKH83_07965 [Arcticibacter tournemirensis]